MKYNQKILGGHLLFMSLLLTNDGLTSTSSSKQTIDSGTALSSNQSGISSLLNLFKDAKEARPVLVQSGEGEAEKNPDHVLGTGGFTVLVEEKNPKKPIVLMQEADETNSTIRPEDVDVTVLIQEKDKPLAPLLVNHDETPSKVILYFEPEFDPPAVLYVENEKELSEDLERRKKILNSTYLMFEPEPDEEPSKTAVCFDQEIIEKKPKVTCKKVKTQSHEKHKSLYDHLKIKKVKKPKIHKRH